MAHNTASAMGAITPMHMLGSESDALVAPGYQIIGKAGISRHRGWVLIMADLSTSDKKLGKIT